MNKRGPGRPRMTPTERGTIDLRSLERSAFKALATHDAECPECAETHHTMSRCRIGRALLDVRAITRDRELAIVSGTVAIHLAPAPSTWPKTTELRDPEGRAR